VFVNLKTPKTLSFDKDAEYVVVKTLFNDMFNVCSVEEYVGVVPVAVPLYPCPDLSNQVVIEVPLAGAVPVFKGSRPSSQTCNPLRLLGVKGT